LTYCHGSTRRYCTPHAYCNRTTVNCVDDCATQFPNEPSCGAVNPGQCGCTPEAAGPCGGPSCDSSGVYHPGTECDCCCRGTSCIPETTCMHSNGTCN
jgi:hypothetical protein